MVWLDGNVYLKKYAHGLLCLVFCCGLVLTDLIKISEIFIKGNATIVVKIFIRLILYSYILWQFLDIHLSWKFLTVCHGSIWNIQTKVVIMEFQILLFPHRKFKQLTSNLSIVYPQSLWVYAGHWPLTVGIPKATLRYSFPNNSI